MSLLTILGTLLIGPLKLVFEIIFDIAHRYIGHPGLAIVVLSLIMNVLVLPLYKRADAMQEEARDTDNKLRDGVNHIKKTFSGDERMMILQTYYRQNNYKPTQALNGSVSLLLEIPFFMAAYQFLSHLDALNNVSLGPIQNLGAPDGLLVVGGMAINLLPVLMTSINVISSAIYLKGFPLKTKLQLYGIALFFLVFLYNSPAGLVFYWTLNNVFSLVKNIFYKLKNPKKIINILLSLIGIATVIFAVFLYENESLKIRAVIFVFGVLMQMPVMAVLLKKYITPKNTEYIPDKKVFILGVIFITVLAGVLIPSTFIASSPEEFFDIKYFYNPMWYIVHSLCMAVGTFIVWVGVFYWLSNKKGKVVFEKLIWIMCGVMLADYLFFGTDLGVLTSYLKYEDGLILSVKEQLINTLAIIIIAAVLYLVSVKWKHKVPLVILTAIIAVSGMSGMNIVKINDTVKDSDLSRNTAEISFQLSKNGKNVVVIMLDRAMGEYMPYILNEKPELKQQYDGFTYYTNVVSFGGHTNLGVPGLVGGYEYTPVEMNKRSDELLVDKHNEALKMVPVLFLENDYKVTVMDPPYAGYTWNSDLSIYDEYPEINAYRLIGRFNNVDNSEYMINSTKRNFFCFSIMKTMPLFVQPIIYNNGNYNNTESFVAEGSYTAQTVINEFEAEGMRPEFMDSYNVLTKLENITEIVEEDVNTYMFMANNTTHETMHLQAPDYVPAEKVDNREYEKENADRFTVDGKTLNMETEKHYRHYYSNMATHKLLGEWMEYLKENDVYDNTRIIIVSDHGYNLGHFPEMYIGTESLEYYLPLLMVKDFDSTGFTVSDDFMTNADVAYLSVKDIIENPINPFTGKPINDDEKYLHDQFISLSRSNLVTDNNGNVFHKSKWASVKDNVWELDNWSYYPEGMVLKEHKIS